MYYGQCMQNLGIFKRRQRAFLKLAVRERKNTVIFRGRIPVVVQEKDTCYENSSIRGDRHH